ncbi:YmiA family putative membrane protein [Rosenbergiella nectarea]|nr:YmiA family putative membrane protein [Rosenbergiella nectarea]
MAGKADKDFRRKVWIGVFIGLGFFWSIVTYLIAHFIF